MNARTLVPLAALLLASGCPYTDGCTATDDTSADNGDAGADAADDGGPTSNGHPAAVLDFGPAQTGGPALSTLACPSLTMPPAPARLYVDATAPPMGDGTKEKPFKTLQSAFDAAPLRAIVWVAAGTYTENVVVPDKDLSVLGGFTGGFAMRTDGCATIFEAADAFQPVFTAAADVRGFLVEGMTIRKGQHGISVNGDETVQANFTIASCVFTNDGTKVDVGGALFLDNVNARVFRNVFKDNVAVNGAAIANEGHVSITIDQNLVENNVGTGDHGGGLYLSATSSTVTRNTFRGNVVGTSAQDGSGASWGGALIVFAPSAGDDGKIPPTRADLSYNVFLENVAGIGGGVFVDEGATLTLSHDLFYRNRAHAEGAFLRGPAIYVDGTGLGPEGGSTLTAEYLTVVGNIYDDQGKPGDLQKMYGGNIYVEGFSNATVKNSIFWNNGENAFYVDTNSTLTVSYSVAANACTSADFNGFIPAPDTACKIGMGVFLPGEIRFGDEPGDDYHDKSTAGRFANGMWVKDTVTSPVIDQADPADDVGAEPAPNGGRANLGVYGRTVEASKTP